MNTPETPATSAAEIRDAIRHLLPHRSFDLTVVPGDSIRNSEDSLVIRCHCGRRLDWPTGAANTLPMDILLWWLIDHDDEMFLIPRELEAKYAARMAQSPVTLDPFGRPLAYDPLGMLGLPAQQAQRAAQRRADAPAAAPAADAEPQQAGNGPQEPAENCAHCGRPRNGYGSYLGAKVCHTGTNPPDADPIDCYRLVTVYREPIGLRLPSSRKSPSEIAIGDTVWSGGAWFAVARVEQWDNWFQFSNAQGATSTWSADQAVYVREQQPTAPPICPGCEMPETNCCCG